MLLQALSDQFSRESGVLRQLIAHLQRIKHYVLPQRAKSVFVIQEVNICCVLEFQHCSTHAALEHKPVMTVVSFSTKRLMRFWMAYKSSVATPCLTSSVLLMTSRELAASVRRLRH